MKSFTFSLAAFALLASTFANPTPQQKTGVSKRQEPDRSGHIDNCSVNDVDPGEDDIGKLICHDHSGSWPTSMLCEECLGLDGNDALKTDGSNKYCAIITDYGGSVNPFTNRTACPGDDVPETDPDGNPSSDLFEGIADAWCAAAGNAGLFGWLNMAACYTWIFSSNQGTVLEENQAGMTCECLPLLVHGVLN